MNPTLYEALRRAFGAVRIAGLGTRPRRDPSRRSGVTGGEYYRVHCFACNDRRFRLYISALYGTRRGPGADYRIATYNTEVAACFNEHCLRDGPAAARHRDELRARIRAAMIGLAPAVAPPPLAAAPVGPLPAKGPPGPVVPLSGLPPGHAAPAYLAGRGFDPAALERDYGVGYCPVCPDYPAVSGRLVYPIVQDGRPVSWQARLVGDDGGGGPKYYNDPAGPGKSRLVYNADRALDGRPLVAIVEGVTDVWRLGAGAAALFGNTASEAQIARLARPRGDRPRALVVLFDPGAEDAARAAYFALAAAVAQASGGRDRVLVAGLPGGDPADRPAAESRWAIVAACVAAGLRPEDYGIG